MMLFHIILAFLSTLISNVSSNYWIKSTAFGGKGGKYFNTHLSTKEFAIRKLEVWQGVSSLRGIRITYSDGTTHVLGKLEDRYTSFELDYANSERVTELAVYNNYVYGSGMDLRNTQCGAFKIVTNKGRTFFPQMTGRQLEWKFMQNPGGGIILGLHGKHGTDIDSLGFIMIRPIRSSVLQNINYNLQHIHSPIYEELIDMQIPNPSYDMVDGGYIEHDIYITTSREWIISGESALGLDFTVSGVIPIIEATAEATASWGLSVEGSYRKSEVKIRDLKYSIPLIAPALSITRIWYYYFTGTASITMSGTMYVTVDNGETWTYPVTGTYDGVHVGRIIGSSKKVANWINGEWVYV